MTPLAGLIAVFLLGISLIAVVNAFTFIRLRKAPLESGQRAESTGELPLVSVLIPARDESGVIGQTLQSLQNQTYPQFEVIVLDDGSRDDTASVARAAIEGDWRFRVASGATLPEGWIGKNWACHQLSQLANGDYLIFTDADVRWEPDAIAAVMAVMVHTQAAGLAVWPTQVTVSWGERLVVPLMALAVLGYLPGLFVHHLPFDSMAAAVGQCLVFQREAYRRIGGHLAVYDQILEDVLLVRRIKRAGLRLRAADATGLISCRMYSDWPSVRDGFAKNILAGHGDSLILLGLSTVFHWVVFLGPWIWLVAGWLGVGISGWPVWPVLLIALGVGARALTAATSRQRPADALLMPISVLLMTRIAWQAVWWRWRDGGPRWKGRVITQRPPPRGG